MKDELKQTLFRETVVKVEVAGHALGLGKSAIYNAVKRGDLPVVRIGGALRVPTAWLRRTLHLDLRDGA